MSDYSQFKAIIRAIRAGLAEVAPPEDGLFGREDVVKFDLPGPITVFVVCERRSLQVRTPLSYHAIGGPRRCRQVLEELTNAGWQDPLGPSADAWQTLNDVIKKVHGEP